MTTQTDLRSIFPPDGDGRPTLGEFATQRLVVSLDLAAIEQGHQGAFFGRSLYLFRDLDRNDRYGFLRLEWDDLSETDLVHRCTSYSDLDVARGQINQKIAWADVDQTLRSLESVSLRGDEHQLRDFLMRSRHLLTTGRPVEPVSTLPAQDRPDRLDDYWNLGEV